MKSKATRTRRRTPGVLPGPVSLFRGKIRAPVSLTLTTAHLHKLQRAVKRLGITRADVIARLLST